MEPKPVQLGRSPILIGGRSEPAIRRAATLGDGLMPYLFTPEQYAAARRRLLQYGAEEGRPATDFAAPMYQFSYAVQSDMEARHILATRLQASYQQPFERFVPQYCTAGAPETAAPVCKLMSMPGYENSFSPRRSPTQKNADNNSTYMPLRSC